MYHIILSKNMILNNIFFIYINVKQFKHTRLIFILLFYSFLTLKLYLLCNIFFFPMELERNIIHIWNKFLKFFFSFFSYVIEIFLIVY